MGERSLLDRSGIYEIRNLLNGKRYIGSAVNLRIRWNAHRGALSRGTHHSLHLQRAWNLSGSCWFLFSVLEYVEKDDLLSAEQSWLDSALPEYNKARFAGSTFGIRLSQERKEKIRAKAIGRRWTEEAKAKVSAALTGRKMSAEFCAKLRGNQHAKGLRHSEEWKKATSERQLGSKRPKTPEHRAKIAAALRGRKASPEAIANQRAAQLGKKRGPYRLKTEASRNEPSLFPPQCEGGG